MEKTSAGFTLIEILLVVAILAILAGIVIIAVNPARQLSQATNSQRRADVQTILNAVYQHALDHGGTVLTEITTDTQEVCALGTGSTASTSCAGKAHLGNLIHNQLYLSGFPTDPGGATTTNGTGYYIKKSANGRITVKAPAAQLGQVISATR